MTGRFIYVFNIVDRNKLIEAGFCLLHSDDRSGVYIFASDGGNKEIFDKQQISYISTSTITFNSP